MASDARNVALNVRSEFGALWKAPTRTMNPTVRQSVIDEAVEADPASAAAADAAPPAIPSNLVEPQPYVSVSEFAELLGDDQAAASRCPWTDYVVKALRILMVLMALGLGILMAVLDLSLRPPHCGPFAVGASQTGSCDWSP